MINIDNGELNVDEVEVSELKESEESEEIDDLRKGKKDPTKEELEEYFKLVKESVKLIKISRGAKEFIYDDGFSCIARNQKNADRKHRNSLKK